LVGALLLHRWPVEERANGFQRLAHAKTPENPAFPYLKGCKRAARDPAPLEWIESKSRSLGFLTSPLRRNAKSFQVQKIDQPEVQH
jgi:hypothetical protein